MLQEQQQQPQNGDVAMNRTVLIVAITMAGSPVLAQPFTGGEAAQLRDAVTELVCPRVSTGHGYAT